MILVEYKDDRSNRWKRRVHRRYTPSPDIQNPLKRRRVARDASSCKEHLHWFQYEELAAYRRFKIANRLLSGTLCGSDVSK